MYLLVSLTVCSAIPTIINGQLPSNFQRCDYKKEDFSVCIKKAIESVFQLLHNSIPEFDIPSFEPYETGPIVIPAGHKILKFTQKFQSLKMYGLTKAKVLNFKINFPEKTIQLGCLLPHYYGPFNFEFEGTLYGEPIKIQGNGTFDYWNTDFNVTAAFTEYEKNGKKHIKVLTKQSLILPQKGSHKFITENRKIGESLEKAIDEHFQEVYADVEEGYAALWAGLFDSNFNKILDKVPVDDIFG